VTEIALPPEFKKVAGTVRTATGSPMEVIVGYIVTIRTERAAVIEKFPGNELLSRRDDRALVALLGQRRPAYIFDGPDCAVLAC
jgi:hypothetical protein